MKLILVLIGAVVAVAAGCGGDEGPREVVLVTHDSFGVSKPVQRAFERETGLVLRVLQSGTRARCSIVRC